MIRTRCLTDRFLADFFARVNRYREAKLAETVMPSRIRRQRHMYALACQTPPHSVKNETTP
jgi:hypothetical protein